MVQRLRNVESQADIAFLYVAVDPVDDERNVRIMGCKRCAQWLLNDAVPGDSCSPRVLRFHLQGWYELEHGVRDPVVEDSGSDSDWCTVSSTVEH